MLASRWLRCAFACVLSLAPVFAHAQSVTLDTPNSTLTPEQFARLMSTTNRIGGGLLVEPTYPGGNGIRLLALPDVDWTYNNRYFANMEDGAGTYLYNDGTLSFGTSGFLRLGRDQTNSPKILGLGNIAEAPQARFATEYDLGWIDLKGAFAHDFSGSYGNTFQAKIGTALPVTNQFWCFPPSPPASAITTTCRPGMAFRNFRASPPASRFSMRIQGSNRSARLWTRFTVLPPISPLSGEAASITSSPMSPGAQ